MPPPKTRRPWDGRRVRALRRHLGLSQDALAGELGTRQQTVSEWETGQYQPRGASATLLSIIAENAGFAYEAVSRVEEEGRRKMGDEPAGAETSEPVRPSGTAPPPRFGAIVAEPSLPVELPRLDEPRLDDELDQNDAANKP